jgi:signal transduction histidine kinase
MRLLNAFEMVSSAIETDFDNVLFEQFSILQSYIIMEHRRAEIECKKRKELEIKAKELEEQSNAVTLHSIEAAHEFQIPLQSLVSIAEYLCKCLSKHPKFICSESERPASDIAYLLMEKLIKLSYIANNLRNLEGSNLRYDFAQIDYIALLEYSIALFREEARKKGIIINDIQFLGNNRNPTRFIEGSENHIKQLFFNIIHNAVKYSFATSKSKTNERFIGINCKEYITSICIEISNFGIGIKEDEIKKGHIFKLGYRGVLAGDRSRIGSGSGLWIAKRIIDDHHGRIEIESHKLGEGQKADPYLTTVRLYLPIKQIYSLSDDVNISDTKIE